MTGAFLLIGLKLKQQEENPRLLSCLWRLVGYTHG